MKKNNSLKIAYDYPHDLMMHIKHIIQKSDVSVLEKDNFPEIFLENFPEEMEEYEILSLAFQKKIPQHFLEENKKKMWAKRVCISQALNLLIPEMGEKKAVIFVESMMCILGWKFEMEISRQWEVQEGDKANFHQPDNRMTLGQVELERQVREREKQLAKRKKRESRREDMVESWGGSSLPVEEQSNGANIQNEERKRERSASAYDRQSPEKMVRQMGKPSLDNEAEVFEERAADKQEDGEALPQNREVKFLSQMNLGMRREVKRAQKGDADSLEKLGSYYAEEGTKHLDYEEAIYWYQLAAKKGNFKAQMGLGQIFDSGKVQDADSKKKGIFWFQKLASEGFPTAQCILGLKYLWGDGVEEDRNEAMKWLQRAAEQGYEQARLYLDDEENR